MAAKDAGDSCVRTSCVGTTEATKLPGFALRSSEMDFRRVQKKGTNLMHKLQRQSDHITAGAKTCYEMLRIKHCQGSFFGYLMMI